MTEPGWEALLARFAEDLSPASVPRDWQSPSAPLPAELAVQARDLLQRQHDRMAAIHEELADVQRQLRALRRVPPLRQDMPILLDRAL